MKNGSAGFTVTFTDAVEEAATEASGEALAEDATTQAVATEAVAANTHAHPETKLRKALRLTSAECYKPMRDVSRGALQSRAAPSMASQQLIRRTRGARRVSGIRGVEAALCRLRER